MSREERLTLVDRGESRDLPIKTQAKLLGLNRSSLYYRPAGPSDEELDLKRRIDEIYTERPYYGARRIAAQLRREGLRVGRKRIKRYMREMGIQAICPPVNLSKRKLKESVYPYLLRGVRADHPDQVWGIDITYIRLRHGWMYLVAVVDWYSRYVVAWELDQTMEVSFVVRAVRKALGRSRPEIFNSDQGSQFTSPEYIGLLKEAEVRISMDGRGRATDNIFTERLWRSVKYEEVYLNDYDSPREARQRLGQYLEYYNHGRPHQALGYRTPAEVYFGSQRDLSEGQTGLVPAAVAAG